jgi:predicted RNA-binding Zn ribbon-like protein
MTEVHSGKSRRRPPRFDLIAGSVPLDFVNTLDDRFTDQPRELLTSYAELARFAEDAGILEPSQADHLSRLSHEAPKEADHALRAAIELREAIYGVIWAIVTGKPVPRSALTRLNHFVQLAAQHSSLVHGDGKFAWQFEDQRNNLQAPVWHIARAAAELLASDQLQFVRACASENCQWLFLDISKNHRRRWCDMTKCGNRAKVRAFYSRQKSS